LTVTLLDDGDGPDQVAGDGIYSAQWTPPALGIYTLTFPGGEVVTVQVLTNYNYSSAPFSWRTITMTSLNLSDDSSAQISSPFPILFGDGSFTNVYIGSNGNVNFSGPFIEYFNASIPTGTISTLVAPFWDDLYPVPGSAQNVVWAVTGAAPNRELVIEWRDVRLFSCNADSGATVKFQVVFFEGSSNILFNYADTAFGGACASADRGGSATVGVQVASNSGNQSSINFPSVNDGTALLWTLVVPPPAISVTPASQDFGSVTLGSSADRSFTVQNSGGGTLTGNATTSATYYSVVSGGSFSLGAGATQTVVVRFAPTAPVSVTGNVNFTSNGGNVSRGVTGTGTAPPAISVTPASQDFGSVTLGSSADRSFTVQNIGGGTLTGNASASTSFGIFSPPGGSFSLGAGTSQTVVVRFTPTAPVSVTGNVNFTSNGGTVSRVVTGTGTSSGQITVLSPNGGDVWRINKRNTIQWTSSGVSGYVQIELSRNGGPWETLNSSTPNDGSFQWKVTGPATTQALIRVRSVSVTTPSVSDTSNANFTIR